MNCNKLDIENDFEWKLRLCKAKLSKEIDLDWQEIVDLLGLDVSSDHLRKTAYGLIEYDNYVNGIDDVDEVVLSLSDIHVPFQLPKEKLRNWINKIDILQLNGDILDFSGCSKFPKTYRVSPMDELINGRQYLIDLISYLRPRKVVANYGNHCARMGTYLAKNLDNELQELMPSNALDYLFVDGFVRYDRKTSLRTSYTSLREVFPDIEFVYSGQWYSQIGDIVFAHPKTFSSSPLKTAEKALYWFRNEGFDFRHIVLAHTHRIGQYGIGNSTIYEQGAFCDTTKMNYSDGLLINSQKQGYILFGLKDNRVVPSKTKLITLN